MSSSDESDGRSNVIDFGRRTGLTGFNLTPLTPPAGSDNLGPVIPAPATPEAGNGTGQRARRSPLELLDALPDPALSTPPVTAAHSPEQGLPDTFRNTEDQVAPQLGALSMAAVLAVAVAALRGSCILLEDRRQRRMAREAEQAPLREARLKHQLAMAEHGYGAEQAAAKHQLAAQQAAGKHAQAMQGIDAKATEQRAKNGSKVPSGPEYGRKTLGNRGTGSSGVGGGKSAGSKGTSGPTRGTGKGTSTGNRSSSTGAGLGGGSKKGSGSGSGRASAGRGNDGGGAKNKPGLGGGAKGSGNGSGASGRGLGGGAKKNGAGSGGAGSQSKKDRRSGTGSGSGSGAGGGSSKKTTGGTGASGSKPHSKSPHRSSQGGGHSLKKQSNDKGAGGKKAGSQNAGAPGAGGRNRKERAAARQDGRLQRLADRQAARLGETAKDRKAARDHKYGVKQDRQDGKNQIRNARAQAKEARREQVRQAKFDAKQQQRAQKADAKRQKKDEARLKKEQAKAAGAGRTRLWDALKEDTARSAGAKWAKRDRGVPPLWKQDKQRQKKQEKQKTGKDQKDQADTGPKQQDSTAKSTGGSKDRWTRMRDRARKVGGWIKDDCFGGTTDTPGPSSDATGESAGSTPPPPGDAGTTNRRARKSPFENAAATGPLTVTLEREDRPTSQGETGPAAALTQGVDALPPAPEPHTQRPGTTRPKEPIAMPPAPVPSQDPRLHKARKAAARRAGAVAAQARHMDAQHATEISLDDALDNYTDFTDDGFKAHEQSHKLAGKARDLAATLEDFAEELAVTNNLIGALFTGAMAGLSEDMELLARMAEEMESSSLQAAEEAEAANNDLNDAYRPISDATADAGLTTPSAPVHNQT